MRRSCSSRSSRAGLGEVRAAQAEELDDGGREAQAEAHEPARAEPSGERDVVDEPHRLVSVLRHAARGPHDVAQQHVGEAARDAPRVERRERRHHVLGRAEGVVLVAVLDVRDAVRPEEPRVNSIRARNVAASISGCADARQARQDRRELDPATGLPVELDVVVAVHHGERVARGEELARAPRTPRAWRAIDARSFARAWSTALPRPCASSSSLGSVVELRAGPHERIAIPMKSMKSPAMTALQRSPDGATRA